MGANQRVVLQTLTGEQITFITKKTISSLSELLRIHPPNANNEIELGNFVYEIDSYDLNLGIYKLISNVNTAIHGYSQLVNKISTNENNVSLITSTSNLFLFQIELSATGIASQAINMEGSTGFESLDMKYVAFSPNTKYGTLKENDRIEIWVTNVTDNTNLQMTLDSFLYLKKL